MTRASLHIVSVATLFTLAGCPSPSVDTESGSASDSASSSGTTVEVTDGTATNSTMTGPVTTTMQTDPTGMSDSDSDSGSTTNPTEATTATTVPPPQCTEATEKADCGDPAAPFCVGEMCVGCDKAGDPNVACAGLDPAAPVCDAGACVECTADDKTLCQGNKPVCGEDNACTACTAHSDCADTACNLETGACFAVDYIIYVDRAAPCEAGDGTMAMPYCKIGQAFEKMLEDVTFGWTIKIQSGNYVEEPLVVPDGSLVAMTSWDGIQPKIRAMPGSGTTLSVANETKLYINNLAFNLNDEFNGVLCESADVWIDNSRMASNANQGYESTNCDTRIRSSVILQNKGGGVASYGPGGTWLTNSYVISNGDPMLEEYGGIRSAQDNQMYVNYSTVVNNLTSSGPRSLQCTADAGASEIRNSVIIAFGGMNSIDCVGGTFSNSALDDVQPGDTNLAATFDDIKVFYNPQVNGVYIAKPDTGLATLGLWKAGDPTTDFDGTARANMDGAADFAGADKP